MPKQIKGLAGRKPPVLSPDHSDIDTWLTQLMPGIQPLAAALDQLICRTHPDATYAVKRMHAH